MICLVNCCCGTPVEFKMYTLQYSKNLSVVGVLENYRSRPTTAIHLVHPQPQRIHSVVYTHETLSLITVVEGYSPVPWT